MNIAQIEENLQKLIKSFKKETFIYSFLRAYGLPKASVTLLQKGNLNMSKTFGEVSWKQKVFFKELEGEDLHEVAAGMRKVIKHKQRFIIATNYSSFVAIDTKTEDKLDIELKELPKHFDFFLPWAGMEKTTHAGDNPADVKAAEKMAKLFDAIKKDNPDESPEFVHGLNVFLSRLLFCFFAEDTGIFTDNQVTNAIDSHTQTDGSDLDDYLTKLFEVLDTPEKDREGLPSHLASFPYVNGSLFRERFVIPKFSRRSRQAIIDSGEMDWSDINPDIFGSMFQAVISVDQRGSLGQHYTSVPNIMKVIEPLFLNKLNEEFEAAKKDKDSKTKLALLLTRLHKIKIFDPACGSGNFLIIAYKELRRLEMRIFKETKEMPLSGIHLSQFYGIEIDDFAHEIAQLALWLAEHQMNVESAKILGSSNPTLPLGEAGQIAQDNACQLNWEEVCPKQKDDEIYILGNPPFVGGKSQSKIQKQDMANVFAGNKNYKELDYIACWFIIATKYIAGNNNCQFSFVTTSSICEGAQVEQLWQPINQMKCELAFAYKPFNWTNNAKNKAGVTCTIIGVRNKSDLIKILYHGDHAQDVKKLNGYLIPSDNVFVIKKAKPSSDLPIMITGNSPYEGGNLMLTPQEKNDLTGLHPEAEAMVRRTYGANEYINGIERHCLWIEDNQLSLAKSIPEIKNRIERIREIRLNGGDVARGLANRPHQFRYTHTGKTSILIIPIVSSSRREYIPMGLVSKDSIILSSAAAIYDSEPYVLGILSSKMHNSWVRLTAGKLRGDIRYLSALSYNTFPFPSISNQRKEEITQCVFRILEEREKHSEKTLAQMYDPDKMPEGLREAHILNDEAIDRCYRTRPFESNEERLEHLFKLYERMIEEEKNAGTLFEKQKKTRKKKANA